MNGGGAAWLCRCSCQTEKVIRGYHLTRGMIVSCGCLRREKFVAQARTRGRNLTGRRFGRLTVLERATENRRSYRVWKCVCSCSEHPIVEVSSICLVNKISRSCGCLRREVSHRARLTHGMSGCVEHRIWKNIRRRCLDIAHPSYPDYGGRGITLSEAWRNNFAQFYADMGPRPIGHSVDRIDNDKGYFKENCRWATAKMQANNRRKARPRLFNQSPVIGPAP